MLFSRIVQFFLAITSFSVVAFANPVAAPASVSEAIEKRADVEAIVTQLQATTAPILAQIREC